jgi:uncharacterized membrane protein YqjE
MAAETMRSRNPAGHAGFVNNLLALVNALAAFVETRLTLLTRESKTALMQVLVLGACLVAALMFFTLGYLFLIGSAVVAVASAAGVSWVSVALAAAGLHFILALICLLIARAKAIKSPFPEFSAELQKDREWLKNLDQTSRPSR